MRCHHCFRAASAINLYGLRGRTVRGWRLRDEGWDMKGNQTSSRPCTESENAGRNRNQFTPALGRTRPPAGMQPRTRGIPRIYLHRNNQPPPEPPPGVPEPRTRLKNASRKPIQSTKVHAITHPATMAAARIRNISTIRQHHEGQPPTHQPRNRPAPRTESEIA